MALGLPSFEGFDPTAVQGGTGTQAARARAQSRMGNTISQRMAKSGTNVQALRNARAQALANRGPYSEFNKHLLRESESGDGPGNLALEQNIDANNPDQSYSRPSSAITFWGNPDTTFMGGDWKEMKRKMVESELYNDFG